MTEFNYSFNLLHIKLQKLIKRRKKNCKRKDVIGRIICCIIHESNPVLSDAMYSSFFTKEWNSSWRLFWFYLAAPIYLKPGVIFKSSNSQEEDLWATKIAPCVPYPNSLFNKIGHKEMTCYTTHVTKP